MSRIIRLGRQHESQAARRGEAYGDCRDIERLFRTWVELSRDKELLALLALLQRDLGRRGYHVGLEIARDAERTREGGIGETYSL